MIRDSWQSYRGVKGIGRFQVKQKIRKTNKTDKVGERKFCSFYK